jgi:putative DNA primase/helicase
MSAPDMERISAALFSIPPDDRDLWVRMGMAIKSELGDEGFDIWDAWSRQSDSYNSRDAKDVWRSINGAGRVTAGTLFHEAKSYGWRDNGHQKPTPEEIEARRRQAGERAAKEKAERVRERLEASGKARAIWKASTPAAGDNPYLVRKRVSLVSSLREIHASAAAKVLGYAPQSRGEPLEGRLLVVPVKVGDRSPPWNSSTSPAANRRSPVARSRAGIGRDNRYRMVMGLGSLC